MAVEVFLSGLAHLTESLNEDKGCRSVAKHLPSIDEGLRSIPRTAKQEETEVSHAHNVTAAFTP